MKAGPRFDIDSLRELAGNKAFARGEAYFRDGLVTIISLEPKRVLAQVVGTEDYRSELNGRGKRIDGDCSCPAFEDWGICKHLVATALAANAIGADGKAEGAGILDRIRDHLKAQSVEALVQMIVELAERDPDLLRKLDLAAAATHGDEKSLAARLRKAIDGATRIRGFVDYREARNWAANVEATLDGLAGLTSGPRAHVAFELASHAIDCIETAAGGIDDSDGHCGALLERARDIHLAAALAVRPDPLRLARDLFTREMEENYDTFSGAAAIYADALGDTGLAEYRRLAQEAWEKLAPRGGWPRQKSLDPGLFRLKHILDYFAEQAGDVEARIALRAKDLSSPWSFLELAQFCLEHGRDDEALRRAEEGLWIFEDDSPDERLVFFTVDLLRKKGRRSDAQALLWRAFEKAPSIELYSRLRKLAGAHAREHVIAFMNGELTNTKRSQWNGAAELLAEILVREKMFDAAWDAVRAYGASSGLKDKLARATEKTHVQDVIAFYQSRVESLANSGGESAYVDAAKLVVRLATIQNRPTHAACVADLKARFARRRNFVRLL